MTTVADRPGSYNRIAYHAQYKGAYGQAIRDGQGRVWFLSDDDEVRRLTDADIPALVLAGRVDLSASQRLADLEAGNAPRICTTRAQEIH